MKAHRIGNILFAVALLSICVAGVANVHQVNSAESSADPYQRFAAATSGETQVADARPNATVFTAYGDGEGHLVAIHANGTLWRYANEFDEYYDVDPLPESDDVIVAAMNQLSSRECPADSPCTREVILRYNLSTGESTEVYSRYRPGKRNNEWHDVDRLSKEKIL
ncbi:hypothetical protein RYH80_06875 [Halobaculum sp. MBLA0147]|uniref:hypothetical protein n=1 Tax=Halobaculum sp. MBLA0147 TaxID=3079934 RepID=UPI003524434B